MFQVLFGVFLVAIAVLFLFLFWGKILLFAPIVPLVSSDENILDMNAARTVSDLTAGERMDVLEQIMPRGVPAYYGADLNVSFDGPEHLVSVLARLDGEWVEKGANAIRFSDLNELQQARYLQIAAKTSCEFCCGARSLANTKGAASCQCAHSAALRGLLKYLLQQYPGASDAQLLEELTKVKTISFPQQMVRRALELKALGKPIDVNTQNLPSQVGGC